MGCDNYETIKCGDKFIHVYFSPSLTGYRLTILNERHSMRFQGLDEFEKYKENDERKVVFSDGVDNFPIGITCGEKIKFVSNLLPEVNTITDVIVETPSTSELYELDSTNFDIFLTNRKSVK